MSFIIVVCFERVREGDRGAVVRGGRLELERQRKGKPFLGMRNGGCQRGIGGGGGRGGEARFATYTGEGIGRETVELDQPT